MDPNTPLILSSQQRATRADDAVEAFKIVWGARRQGELDHMDVAVLTKDAAGELQVERHDSTAKHFARGGALVGAALVIVAPPVGIAAIAAGGAAVAAPAECRSLLERTSRRKNWGRSASFSTPASRVSSSSRSTTRARISPRCWRTPRRRPSSTRRQETSTQRLRTGSRRPRRVAAGDGYTTGTRTAVLAVARQRAGPSAPRAPPCRGRRGDRGTRGPGARNEVHDQIRSRVTEIRPSKAMRNPAMTIPVQADGDDADIPGGS